MKKYFLFSVMLFAATMSLFAQKNKKSIGLNLGYGSEIKSVAFGAKFNYGLTDQIRLSPNFNYFLKKDGISGWEVNADVHYLFPVAPKVTVYPLAGLTFTGWKFDWGEWIEIDLGYGDLGYGEDEVYGEDASSTDTETKFGVNLGGGIAYQLTDKISFGLELKYSIVSDFDQFVPCLNLMYKF